MVNKKQILRTYINDVSTIIRILKSVPESRVSERYLNTVSVLGDEVFLYDHEFSAFVMAILKWSKDFKLIIYCMNDFPKDVMHVIDENLIDQIEVKHFTSTTNIAEESDIFIYSTASSVSILAILIRQANNILTIEYDKAFVGQSLIDANRQMFENHFLVKSLETIVASYHLKSSADNFWTVRYEWINKIAKTDYTIDQDQLVRDFYIDLVRRSLQDPIFLDASISFLSHLHETIASMDQDQQNLIDVLETE